MLKSVSKNISVLVRFLISSTAPLPSSKNTTVSLDTFFDLNNVVSEKNYKIIRKRKLSFFSLGRNNE